MRKLTLQFAQNLWQENGCVLLATKYKDSDTPMPYICKCGNKSKIALNNFKQGHRCSGCRGGVRHSYEYVYQYFKDRNCTLLSTSYVNARTTLDYICECGIQTKTIFDRFQKGCRCKICGLKKVIGKNNCNWNPDREEIKVISKIRKKSKNALETTLRYLSIKKKGRARVLLGFSNQDLIKRIQNHPNWLRVKNQNWHLDHIYPIKAFIDYGITDIKLINCLDNLQPLLAKENMKKHDKYNKQEFEAWLTSKNINFTPRYR